MQKYCLALDLIDQPDSIREYEKYHVAVWPEIIESIKSSGIVSCEIFRVFNRLFMIIEATDDFSFDQKALSDSSNEKVIEWENLMWKYQQALPGAKPGEKWVLMSKIFDLNN